MNEHRNTRSRVQSTERCPSLYPGMRTDYIEMTRRILPTESIPIRSIITRYRSSAHSVLHIFYPPFPFSSAMVTLGWWGLYTVGVRDALVWSTLTVTLPYPTLWCLLYYAQLSSALICSDPVYSALCSDHIHILYPPVDNDTY